MGAWLMRRQKLLAHLKSQVAHHLGPMDREIEIYRSSFLKEFEGEWEVYLRSQMLEKLSAESIVLGGDFHAFPQSQRTHLRIIRDFKVPFALGLECIEARYQDALDRYMLKELDDETFLSEVKWEENWGFPWIYYRPLIDFAREHSVPVFAINKKFSGDETLKMRDEEMAQTISQKYSEINQLLYIIVGEYHLAKAHLPKSIYQLRGFWPRVIFQDSEKLYFQWAESVVEESIGEPIKCMKNSEGDFCMFTSPPWVKWQNYLIYLEKTHDKALDVDGGELIDSTDYTESIFSLVKFLARDLGVEVDVNDLSVYSPVNQDYLDDFLSQKLSPDELAVLRWKMSNDRSFCLPHRDIIYLSRGTTNHAATVAGQYLHGKISSQKRIFCHFPNDFIPSIWIEGIGYFMSKLVNYRRKTESVGDIRAILETSHPNDRGRESLQLSLSQRMGELIATDVEALKSFKFKPKSKTSYFESSRILGQMLGERLYTKYRDKKLSLSEIKALLKENIEGESFLEKYLMLQAKLSIKKIIGKEDFL